MVMRAALRVDASARIGTGHVRRCAAVADSLREAAVDLGWVSRDLGIESRALAGSGPDAWFALPPPSGRKFEPAAGDPAHAAWAEVDWQEDADQTVAALRAFASDWLILDHYAFDRRWIERVRAALGTKICVIDDLADRPLSADILVDHNLDADHRAKYAQVAPEVGRLLGGPRYALLSAAFRDAKTYEPSDVVRSIGIFLGGTDPWGLSSVVLRACREVARFTGRIEVVTTRSNPNLAELKRDCAALDATLLIDLPDLAAFFARHDLQVGAGGGAALERCRIGAPSIGLVCAANQAHVISALAAAGALRKVESNDVAVIGAAVAELVANPAMRRQLAETARQFVDGRGARRVAVALAADAITLREARADDAAMVYPWRNDPRTWRHFRNPGHVPFEEHVAWWEGTLRNPSRKLLIASCGAIPVGTLRFDLDAGGAEVSLYLDPDLTGVGLGPALLRAGQRWIGVNLPALTHLDAEILEANQASSLAFAAAGFVQVAPRQWRAEIRR